MVTVVQSHVQKGRTNPLIAELPEFLCSTSFFLLMALALASTKALCTPPAPPHLVNPTRLQIERSGRKIREGMKEGKGGGSSHCHPPCRPVASLQQWPWPWHCRRRGGGLLQSPTTPFSHHIKICRSKMNDFLMAPYLLWNYHNETYVRGRQRSGEISVLTPEAKRERCCRGIFCYSIISSNRQHEVVEQNGFKGAN